MSSPSSSAATSVRAGGVGLVVCAGGQGLRMGGPVPKQFVPFRGRPLLRATVEAFFGPGMPEVARVALAVPEDRLEEVSAWAFPAPTAVVRGGATRQDSVCAALAALEGLPGDRAVLIHDAVRPFPPPAPIRAALAALADPALGWDGAVLAEPSTDTLKRVDPTGRILATEPREAIMRAQTPQMAALDTWRRAFAWAREAGFQGTDDVSLLEALGLRVLAVASPGTNLKLTVPEDWARAQALEPQGVVASATDTQPGV